MNFVDFDRKGARVTTANLGLILGYSIVYVTVWAGRADFDPQLAYVRLGGWARG